MAVSFDIHIPKKGKHKLVPSVAIQLIWESIDENEKALLTPHMSSDKEIDASIDHIIGELNILREKTKLELKRHEIEFEKKNEQKNEQKSGEPFD